MTAIASDLVLDHFYLQTSNLTRTIPIGSVDHRREENIVFLNNFKGLATTNNYAPIHRDESTTANIAGQIDGIPVKTTAEAVLEIRRRSGLTWDELGEIFDVSRRSVHHWANGRKISAKNERVVHQTLAAINHLDEGERAKTRRRLLDVGRSHQSPFNLLASHEFEQILALIPGSARPARRIPPLAPQEREAWQPPAPVTLLSANPERFRSSSSKARIARPVRTPKKR